MGIRTYNILGIGLGPANLSLAALIEGSSSAGDLNKDCLFLEARHQISWHPGQLFPMVRMQSEFTRDLVTLADPTNRFSYLSFLKQHGRLMQFINSGTLLPFRAEVDSYFRWVASQLRSVTLNAIVTSVDFSDADNCFFVRYRKDNADQCTRAANVVIGTGLAPVLLPLSGVCAARCLHVCDFLSANPQIADKHVAIVGSGQSAAEMLIYLLSTDHRPSRITWITRSHTFAGLDTTHFSREFYTPHYANAYFAQSTDIKAHLASVMKRSESGISPSVAEWAFQMLYFNRHLSAAKIAVVLRPCIEVQSVSTSPQHCVLSCRNWRNSLSSQLTVDFAILCTGYSAPRLQMLSGLESRGIRTAPPLDIRSDYSLEWNGPMDRRLFAQSFAHESHGLPDRNLAMVCHRNIAIINAIAGRDVFPADPDDTLVDWFDSDRHRQSDESIT